MTEKNEEAFSRLRNNRKQLSATLETLRAGALKQQVAALADNSSSLDRNISALLEQESMLRRFLAANEKVAELEATLLELSEEILVLTLDHQGKPREVMAATQLMMLSQRLAKNFNLLYLENTMETEAVFLIGKDSRTMHELIREMIHGSETLGLAPAHQEIKLKLLKLADSFSEVEVLVAATMKDLPQLIAMKKTSAAVQEQCGGLQMQLVRLLSTRLALAQNY
jgi:twitching motility protein PilJ